MNFESSVTLGQLCDAGVMQLSAGPAWARLLGGGRAHEHAADHYTSSAHGIPLLSPGAISAEGVLAPGADQRLRADTAAWPELRPYRLQAGDVLLARQGALGHGALISPEQDGWFYNAALYRLRIATEPTRPSGVTIIPEYLHMHFSRPRVREWMIGQAVGQTVPTLTIERLRALEIPLPPLYEQNRLWLRVLSIDRQMARHQRALALLTELKAAMVAD